MKILLTGAHFTPAQAVMEELKKIKNVDILYVGRDTTLEGDITPSIESKIIPTLGIKFIPITTGRLQMAFTPYTFFSLLRIPVGFIQAFAIILSEKPDVILSFGGYVAFPLVIVGWLFSIPIIVHEQTLVSGLANKASAFFADKIAFSFKENFSIGDKTILTGNPIRKNVLESRIQRNPKPPTILIMGGIQGSHAINVTIEKCLDKLLKIARIVHISGDNKFKDFERLEQLGDFGGRYIVQRWIGEEYGAILQKADLVVSRAGINTLTELAYIGKPALVIPIPYLYGDEQNKNAKYFASLGLVKILPQSKLSANTLLENLKLMLGNLNQLKKKAKNAKEVIIEDASKRLALETILLA